MDQAIKKNQTVVDALLVVITKIASQVEKNNATSTMLDLVERGEAISKRFFDGIQGKVDKKIYHEVYGIISTEHSLLYTKLKIIGDGFRDGELSRDEFVSSGVTAYGICLDNILQKSMTYCVQRKLGF